MNEIIDKGADRFGRTKKEVTIHLKSQRDIWSVEVDQQQIEQVLLNLYVNAWQAMPGASSAQVGQLFRSIPANDSRAKLPPVPEYPGHP